MSRSRVNTEKVRYLQCPCRSLRPLDRIGFFYYGPRMDVSLSDLPEIKDGHAFNQARWAELCSDAALAALDYRIETDRFGHILMSPPPSFQHSDRQGQILENLTQLLKRGGRARPEIPLSTREGVKAIDAGWISEERLACSRGENLLTMAPEICIEVLSP